MKRRNFEGKFPFEQVDLISAMTNSEARDHLLGALPTGYGKSLPMLVASLLLLLPVESTGCASGYTFKRGFFSGQLRKSPIYFVFLPTSVFETRS